MRFSWNFLREFLDLPLTPQELGTKLTMVGMEVERIERAKDDWIFDIEVTTNRYDWLSIIGIAYEIRAVLGIPLKLKYPKIRPKGEWEDVEVKIEDYQDCFLYMGRLFTSVQVKESPKWLKDRLEHCGIKSINNVVDITNYCMLKWGNPLHAFDRDKIEGNVYIRRAKEGERFLGLDDKERILTQNNLVIADDKKVIALAGIMGAQNTAVDFSTKNIFLEGAIFSPLTIRKSVRRAGLATESSYRFERSVIKEHLIYALDEVSQLIEELCKGEFKSKIQRGKIDRKFFTLDVNLDRIQNFVGENIPLKEVRKILRNLGFSIIKSSQNKLKLRPPYHRLDIKYEVDVYEEITRIYGYDRIKERLPRFDSYSSQDTFFNFKNKLRNILSGLGFKEIISFSLTSQQKAQLLGETDFIKILNPLHDTEDTLRPTLLLGMLEVIAYNLNQQNTYLQFFEIANVYRKNNDSFKEYPNLSLAMAGSDDFTYFKGKINKLWELLGIEGVLCKEVEHPAFSSCGEFYIDEERIGHFGLVSDTVCNFFDIKVPLWYAEINVEFLYKFKKKSIYKPFSRYPKVVRDINILIPQGVQEKVYFKEIEDIIQESANEYFSHYELIDIYRGKNIPPGHVSITLRIVYQSFKKTLTSQEVDSIHNSLRERLSQKKHIILR